MPGDLSGGGIKRLEALASEQQLPEDIVQPLRAYSRERLTDLERRDDSNEHYRQLIELSDDRAPTDRSRAAND